ncbi:MAG TPA: hypothetical protein VMV29_12355 [Ktedonobacterales bacterium]|nr:hypothetical protein [Ktedonobacterales bacterium]
MLDLLRRVNEWALQLLTIVWVRIVDVATLPFEAAEWKAIVSTPESRKFLAQLAEEARAENAAGSTRDLDELL